MRVGAPRPRHTSHGDEKNTDSTKEASGEKTDETDPKEEEKDAADEEQASRFVTEYFHESSTKVFFSVLLQIVQLVKWLAEHSFP